MTPEVLSGALEELIARFDRLVKRKENSLPKMNRASIRPKSLAEVLAPKALQDAGLANHMGLTVDGREVIRVFVISLPPKDLEGYLFVSNFPIGKGAIDKEIEGVVTDVLSGKENPKLRPK